MGYKPINAGAETVATTASYRKPFKSQRCLFRQIHVMSVKMLKADTTPPAQ
jgi:hypothetical protein